MSVIAFKKAADAVPDYLNEISSQGRIEWADQKFGKKLVLTTSFGIQSAVLLHMATQIRPDIPVIFIDTGYLFPQTYEFAEKLTQRLFLNLHVYSAGRSAAMQEAVDGRRWEGDEEAQKEFALETKIEPLNRAFKELGAKGWISGLRRDQNDRRAGLDVTETQNAMLKVYPLIDWTSKDIYQYLKKYDLPYHPLFDEGYTSVGNWFESQPGLQRSECGIHVPAQFQPAFVGP